MCLSNEKQTPEVDEVKINVQETAAVEAEGSEDGFELTDEQANFLLKAIFGIGAGASQELSNETSDVEYTIAEVVDHRDVCGNVHMFVVGTTTDDRISAYEELLSIQAENPGKNYVLASRSAR